MRFATTLLLLLPLQASGQDAERLRLSCDDGNATACYNLGHMYEPGEGATRNLARAASLYEQACDGGSALGCSNLGGLYFDGEGVSRDFPRAASLYQQACDSGYAVGCHNIGFMYEHALGVPQNSARAASRYETACDGGVASVGRRMIRAGRFGDLDVVGAEEIDLVDQEHRDGPNHALLNASSGSANADVSADESLEVDRGVGGDLDVADGPFTADESLHQTIPPRLKPRRIEGTDAQLALGIEPAGDGR